MVGKCVKANVCPSLLTTSYVYCRTSREFKGVMCDICGLCSWPLQSLFSLGPSFPVSEVGVYLFQYVVLPFPSLKCNFVRGWTRSSAHATQSLNFSISPPDHNPNLPAVSQASQLAPELLNSKFSFSKKSPE